MKAVLGYNVIFKANSKTFVGITSDELSVDATIKDSLLKSDRGERKYVVTGHEITLNASGICHIKEAGDTDNNVEADLLSISLKKGAEAEMPINYIGANNKTYTGRAVMTSYKETSSADGEATYSASFRVWGLQEQSQSQSPS